MPIHHIESNAISVAEYIRLIAVVWSPHSREFHEVLIVFTV